LTNKSLAVGNLLHRWKPIVGFRLLFSFRYWGQISH